jgi:hypothetical protein
LGSGHDSTSAIAARRILFSTACRSWFRSSSSAASRFASSASVVSSSSSAASGPRQAGGVDPRREPESDGRGVDGGGVDPRVLHQRLKAGPLRTGERAQARDREGAVLVEQRDDVGDRGERDQVEIRRDIDAERLCELADDAGAAELRERIVRRARRDDWAVRQAGAGAVVVGDDHVEAVRLRSRDLPDCCDPAVDGHQEAAALVGESRRS